MDLLSALIAAEEDGSRLDDDELIAMCVLLLFAGHETTTHLIGNGILALIEWPNEFDRLSAEPGLLQPAVEEFLRFDSPVQATGRRATADMEIRGCAIRAGEFLTPVIAAANRDPSVFDHPDRLDINDEIVKKCVEVGVNMSIDSDAHAAAHLSYLPFGIAQARRGWAGREDIINCWPLEKMLAFLKR